MRKDMPGTHVIIAETRQGRITQETFESISCAREYAGGMLPHVILPGNGDEHLADELAERSGCAVTLVQGDDLGTYNAECVSAAIMEALSGMHPSLVILSHSSVGLDCAPRLAVLLEAACVTAVEKVHGRRFTRSMYSGRYVADLVPQTDSVVITLLAGAYPPYSPGNPVKGPVETLQAKCGSARIRTLRVSEPLHRDSTLKDAEVIVAAGRGLGKKENIGMIRELASLFPRSAVGASRSVCDLGWLEYGRQIGTTGQTVAPKLYIACGISGAIQHVAGMKGAQTIVAINTDPEAAIFRVAHICIVEDTTTFIPVLMEEMEAGRGGP